MSTGVRTKRTGLAGWRVLEFPVLLRTHSRYPIPARTKAPNLALILPTNPTEFWTLVAGIGALATAGATVALFFMAKKGLASLRLTEEALAVAQQDMANNRSDMAARFLREGKTLSAELAREMASELLPSNAVLLREMETAKVQGLAMQPDPISFDSPAEEAALPGAKVWRAQVPDALYSQAIGLLNRFECWAMHFTHGLADPECNFQPCAQVFCSVVIQLYPALVYARGAAAGGGYTNVIKLYGVWAAKIEDDKAAKMAQALQTRAPGPTLPPMIGPTLT